MPKLDEHGTRVFDIDRAAHFVHPPPERKRENVCGRAIYDFAIMWNIIDFNSPVLKYAEHVGDTRRSIARSP